MRDPSQDLVDRIYEAAVLPDFWPSVLEQLAEVGDGKGAMLFSVDGTDMRWLGSPSMQAGMTDYIAAGWHTRTDRAARLFGARYAGFLDDLDVYTPEEFEREPVFVEFLRPRGFGRGAATAIAMPSGELVAIDVERAYERGPASRETLDRLDLLRPHLARAALLSARLRLERARSAADALGLVGLPAAVLGRSGRALAANDLLGAIIPQVVNDKRDRLALADAVADGMLAEALAQLQADTHRGVRSIPIRARGQLPPMIVHLLPVRRTANDVFSGAAGILVVTPVQPHNVPSAEVLQGLFDLTPAEARVARAIAERQTVETIADAFGLSRATVRTQLNAVFVKTGMGRQVDLAALLAGASLPGGPR